MTVLISLYVVEVIISRLVLRGTSAQKEKSETRAHAMRGLPQSEGGDVFLRFCQAEMVRSL